VSRGGGPSSRRRIAGQASLRLKLVATVVVLAAAGLAVAGIATTTGLHDYLLSRVDDQLRSAAGPIADFGGRQSGLPAQPAQPATGRVGSGPAPRVGGRSLPGQFYVQQFNAAGAPTQTRSAPLAAASPPKLPRMTLAQVRARSQAPFTVASTSGSSSWRVVIRVLPNGSGSVAVATSLSDLNHTVTHLVLIETLIGVVVLVLIGSVGWLLVRRSLRPLVAVEHTAAAIAAGDLSQRVPDGSERTEVGRLSRALNGMLGQIEDAFAHERSSQQRARASEARMRRFVADASHELRTPITSIRGFAEFYRMGGATEPEDLPRMMRRIEDEAARMGVLVEDLLLLARLDQQRPLDRQPVDLLPLARDAVHDAAVLAPDRAVDLEVDGDAAPIVTGDEARLRQVFHNLVANALTHTPAGTAVTVRLSTAPTASPGTTAPTGTRAEQVVLEVSDRGPGIAETDTQRVFERFYRADESRSRQAGGNGLGLSIVAGLVAAHGGSVSLHRREGGGATFRTLLPLRPTSR
jgi:two-component system OmpR family sensor kinase